MNPNSFRTGEIAAMSHHRVLIADDDAEMANVLARRCRQMGLAVETATTAMDALQKLQSRPPDAAILDVHMPQGNGLAVCEMIANDPALNKIPVIVLTGAKAPDIVRRCHELRAFYVTKCSDVWPRIGPLLQELLELPAEDEGACAGEVCVEAASQGGSPDASRAQLMDDVFAALAVDDDVADVSDNAGAGNSSEAEQPWVLSIDDDEAFSYALQLRLQKHGVGVQRAFAGRAGYRTAFRSQAHAIILDYELPDGNGDYVLRRLKENPVTRDIPVISLTGKRDRQVERTMYSLGAAAFFNKPYVWSELWAELQRHLPAERLLPQRDPPEPKFLLNGDRPAVELAETAQ
jgi:CheY-like chemotaxis protein